MSFLSPRVAGILRDRGEKEKGKKGGKGVLLVSLRVQA
jgi:hypothetical protein